MKLVAWNLNHKASERTLKPAIARIVHALRPDVLILSEYVHGESRAPFLEALTACDLRHVLWSDRLNSNNQILVASRFPLSPGDLTGPVTEDKGGESNFLHAQVGDFEIVGVRAPAYTQSSVLRDYWQQLATTIRGAASRKIVFLGDFNADPKTNTRVGDRHLAALVQEGWSIPDAEGAWSYSSGTRVDHAVVSPSVGSTAARYITEIEGMVVAGRGALNAASDHAALVVELSPNAA